MDAIPTIPPVAGPYPPAVLEDWSGGITFQDEDGKAISTVAIGADGKWHMAETHPKEYNFYNAGGTKLLGTVVVEGDKLRIKEQS